VRIHLDTDLAGDPDDVCALVYLLARDDVDVVGITTVDDPGGVRAGFVHEVLRMAGRSDVPVAAGAEASLATGRRCGGPAPSDRRYWPAPVAPRPGPVGAALDLVAASVEADATVVGIGPATTLALAERRSPGLLGRTRVVLMGGWLEPPGGGLPQWRAADDWNVTCDVVAAAEVRRAAGELVVVPLAATALAHLRSADLPRLRAAGRLGALMAGQAEAYRDDQDKAALARAHARLPDDLANFHHDPLTAAVAAGWSGVTIERRRLRTVSGDPHARLTETAPDAPDGREVDVVIGVDGPRFSEHWLTTVEALAEPLA
jgi:inosine-uridine nucleoside N-ribohydrolase